MDETTVAQHWDANAPAWIEGVRAGYDVYRQYIHDPAFFTMLGDVNGKIILDIGCGEGHSTRKLADRGALLTGIDISAELISAAIDHGSASGQNIQYQVASASYLDCFESNSFDGAISTMALMDIPDYTRGIREVARVVKTNGFFQFSILHPLIHLRQFKWVRNTDGLRIGAEIGDYFGLNNTSDTPDVEEWKFGHAPAGYKNRVLPFRVPYFRRTLSEYMNCLVQNGFKLVQMNEPYAEASLLENFPQMQDSRTLPYFLIGNWVLL